MLRLPSPTSLRRLLPRRYSSVSAGSRSSTIGARLTRILLVGGSVGLATPLFAVGGVVQIWRAYLPRTPAGEPLQLTV